MIYQTIKFIARLALPIYCRDISINKKELFKQNGPLLLSVNHPNSFLDAIILCTLFNAPVYSLARGDAFKNNLAAKILTKFKMFPVYRVSEGVENLDENYKTFDLCKNIFKQNGIVLIFSEGKCVNEWHLRALKKGTARLAISSWQDGIDLKVLPVALNYSSFKKFGKNIKLFFGEIITKNEVDYKGSYGNATKQFNEVLKKQLSNYIFEIDNNDKATLQQTFYVKQLMLKKVALFIPAVIGGIIHAPLYYFTKWLGNFLVKDKEHFDSVIIGLLLILYPIFLLKLSLIFFYFTQNGYSFLTMLVLPFCAWAYVQLKKQL